MNGWIGVDLDGTLAEYNGWIDEMHIGKPIPKMVERVKQWLSEGKEVKVFTARVCGRGTRVSRNIQDWTEKHIGKRLDVTCCKDYSMVELWDDRCVQVLANTGVAIQDAIDIDTLHRLQD